MTRHLQFWFEFASTYSYLSAARIEAMCAERAIELEWKPFLLGPIFADQGWADSPFNIYPARGAYMWRDLERQCARFGVAFRRPSTFPRSGVLAARIACAHSSAPWIGGFVRAVYTANFAEDREISHPGVVSEILATLGQNAEEIIDTSHAGDAAHCLRLQTEGAKRRGIFGAPSFVVGEELFWGNDRLDEAVEWCAAHG
ncbi:MAG: 2-hydroxychromene-2-carboxylate isomerase [Hyphomicrobiales bacterium]|nr:2-hydroxychromene-2-carboxylate isomerase [Hyphomicrobiales bacterium]